MNSSLDRAYRVCFNSKKSSQDEMLSNI